jgi:RNA-directed DNA polymerase
LSLIGQDNCRRPLPSPVSTRRRLDQVATAILCQTPTDPPPLQSGQPHLLAKIPAHKSLYHTAPGVGMPIGSLTSQFFANVYLNELEQFIKYTLKVQGYLRYVDDFVLLADDPGTLMRWRTQIEDFLWQRLRLRLHPHKTMIQRCAQGAGFFWVALYFRTTG